MPGKQAKILSTDHIDDLLFFADNSRSRLRNRLIVLLSTKAGLRAGEIAKLTWDMVLGAGGEVGAVLELRDHAAKMGSGRLIPLHPDLQQALSALRQSSPGAGPVVCSERGGPMKPLSIVIWFQRAYEALGFDGSSSFGTAYIYHASRTAGAQGWRILERRPTAGGTPIHPDHPTLY
jgi:integrase/recombinase XerD